MSYAELILAIVVAVLGSNGLWAFIQSKSKHKSDRDKLLLGIAYKGIIETSEKYIDRGWIEPDEYNELNRYLLEPYQNMGGDGTAEKMMAEVKSLPSKPAMTKDDVIAKLP